MPIPLLSTSEASYILSGLLDGQRHDLRPLQSYRPIHLESHIVPNAQGSARVHLGGTEITVAVSVEVDVRSDTGGSSGMSQGGVESSVQL